MVNCEICNTPIKGEYLLDAYSRACHEFHGGRLSEHCYSCKKLCDPKYMKLYEDGRKICEACHGIAVNSIEKGRSAYTQVLNLYSHAKIPLPKERIRLFINDQLYAKQHLNKNNFHGLMWHTRKTSFRGVENKYKVFIINGLHPVVFKGVLAHELMHIYLKENDYQLDIIDEEGLCELMAYFTLKATKTQIGNVNVNFMNSNSDPVYGVGFRKIKAVYDKHPNIHKLLGDIRQLVNSR